MTGVWTSLFLSLRIAVAATLVAALIAVPAAFFMARRSFRGKSILEAFITLPLVLPPTVVGYCIIVTLGVRAPVGRFITRLLGHPILFSFEGAVLAAAVVSLPLLYLPARSAFAAVSREMEETARMMGAGRLRVFFHISLPLARRGIISGLVLAFARSLGELGATVMVFGMSEDRMTLPISVFTAYESEPARAIPAVIALSALSLILIMAYNRSSAGRQD
jgi:molybdate transport system permease protein